MSTQLISVADAMAAALDHHRQGRLGEATELYRRVLAVVERGAPLDPAVERALFGGDEAGEAPATSV